LRHLRQNNKVTPTALVICICCSAILMTACADKSVKRYSRHQQTENLLSNLGSADKKVRVDTIVALGKMRDPRSIDALSKRLKSDNWVEREAVVKALANINDYMVIRPLFSALTDKDQFVKETAQKSLHDVVAKLGKKRDPRMIKQITVELSNKEFHVRRVAAKLLRTAVRSLRFVKPKEYLKYILPVLKGKNRFARRSAAVILREIKDPLAYEALIVALKDPVRDVKDAAAESLLAMKKPESVKSIMAAMGDNDPFVRSLAARLIRKYNKGSGSGNLADLLKSKDPKIRETAIIALHDNEDEGLVDRVIPLLHDSSSLVRSAAVRFLEQKEWKPSSDELIAAQCVAKQDWTTCQKFGLVALKPLLVAARDIDPEVRKSASDSLAILEWTPKTKLEEAQYCIIRNEWEKCQQLGEVAVDLLINELTHVDITVRINVINTLGLIGSKKAVPSLIGLMKDRDQEIRKTVVKNLAYFNSIKVIQPLIQALDDTVYEIRLSAAQSLQANLHVISKTKDVRIVQPIINALKDNNRVVRKIAATILGEIQNVQIVPPLMIALKDKDPAVRKAASKALHKMKNPITEDSFVKGLRSDSHEVRKESVDILGDFNNINLLPHFERMLEDPNLDVRIASIEAVGKFSGNKVIPIIETALKDKVSKVRLQAVTILAKYEKAAVIPALLRASNDKNIDVRDAARRNLIDLKWQPETQGHKAISCIIRQQWTKCLPLGIDALRPLLIELKFDDARHKAEIVKVLGRLGNPQAVDGIINVIRASRFLENGTEREKNIKYALRALRQIGKPSKVKLIPYLNDWYVGEKVVDILTELGWKTNSEKELIHYFIAKRNVSMLLSQWKLTKKILFSDVQNGTQEAVTNALYTLIGLGVEDSVDDMITMLHTKGSIRIAESYLNSGNDELVTAAINWIHDRGHVLLDQLRGNQPVTWGKL